MRFGGGSAGTVRRIGRLLGSGDSPVIIVAMDQGMVGVPTDFSYPEEKVRSVLAAEPSGILLNVGMARRVAPLLAYRGAPGLVIAIDQVIHQDPRGAGPAVAHAAAFSVDEAVRLGADAVKTMLVMGLEDRVDQLQNMRYLAETSEACRRWEVPMMVEPYLWGKGVSDGPTERAELAADGARIAIELGADLLKIEYGADADVFRRLVDASPVPVLVLGGPKRAAPREVLVEVIAAVEVGAAGITMGRNVWQQADPVRMVRALSVAMSTRDVDAAMAELGLAGEAASP